MLSVFMVFILLVGCSNNSAVEPEKEQGDSETEPVSEEEPESDLYELGKEALEVSFYGNYGWYQMPRWGADPATKWIEDNLKVHVTAVSSGGNNAQKLQTMIAGNELPDIVWTERGPDIERLREAG